MSSLTLTILVGLAAGIAVGIQGPLAGLMSNRIGLVESAFYIHLSGMLTAGIILLFFKGGRLNAWRTVPWYALGAGALGVIVISGMSFLIPRIGVAPSTILILAAQIAIGVILDQFGWLDAAIRPLDLTRGMGMALVFIGVWLAIK